MAVNIFAAVFAGYVLDMMFSRPPAFMDIEKYIKNFAGFLEKKIGNLYQDSSDAKKAAGILILVILLVQFVGLPGLAIFIAYKIHSVLGFIIECIFCWTAFSLKDNQNKITRVYRGLRSKRIEKSRIALCELTGEDCSELTEDEIIRKSVICTADSCADNGAGTLFFMAIAGSLGGLFYSTVSIYRKIYYTDKTKNIFFAKIANDIWKIIDFIPAKICSFIIFMSSKFLKFDSSNCKEVMKSDMSKTDMKNLAPCRCAMAGSLGIYLKDNGIVIGTDKKQPENKDIYWAKELMHYSVFFSLILFLLVRFIIAIIF